MDKGYKIKKVKGGFAVAGHCGGGRWMVVSSVFKTQAEAHSKLKHQIMADRSAKRELSV